ncbi:hypothetical protein QCN36_gp54 [Arthrobacter phage CastorTray]|jgi:hypothetical protein|uniref:Uncharacterized protein n=10 Tax=Gordonvirus TaxID=1982152 RepID=A0A9E7NIG6_9CAUD|nr:hypothetical protein FDH68_gp49 [Arthrobacter phage CaptnMurica]YP_009603510.1 hypothetical protein FDH69_gp49 [Arthrobacter phage Gordon]YP_010749794.1 hypothetical protein QCN31_gp52 [Arthrobacter phage Teacup]YP_010749881.1 hypothetical protein QCN32_gp51 [Arthrobacter phage Niktson]YP_010750066.1 hypothetical protein QCN34_gp51 [Arthrobacter phage Breylor17]YP_010750149.1 hypothetical protein QCN35_gp50 [Arthrobacter phage Synepsis]YP_010750237.1 hypothetical protein QCN36_gp54 [Arthro
MTITQKRIAVANAYPGEKWASRVRKMPDEQIHTVYTRLMNAGKL